MRLMLYVNENIRNATKKDNPFSNKYRWKNLHNTKRSQYSVATKCFNGHEKGSWIIVDIKAEIKDEKSVFLLNEWENGI